MLGINLHRSIAEAISRPKTKKRESRRFWLVELPDGGWPILRSYTDPREIALHLADLRDSSPETLVVIFEGVPMPLSADTPLCFLLPDQQRAVIVPDRRVTLDRVQIVSVPAKLFAAGAGSLIINAPFTERPLDRK